MSARTTTKHRVPKYRAHAATGQARVTLNGRTYYLGEYGSPESREIYDRKIAEWLANDRQPARDRNGVAVVEVILAYDKFAEEYYGTDSRELEKIRMSVGPLQDLYGRLPVKDFDGIALEAIQYNMTDNDLARTTINERVGVIKRMFKWAVRKKLCPSTVIGEILLVPGLKRGRCRARETDPVRPVADRVVKATLPYIPRPLAAVVALQQLTGARSGELLIMRLCDIQRQGTVWIYRPTRFKTQYRGHAREIYLGPRAQKILRPFMSIKLDEFLFSPCRDREARYAELRKARKSSVQPSQVCRRKRNPKLLPGDHYTPASYRRAIARACEEAGVPIWHPHQIRHSVATNIRAKYGVETAQLMLGHASLAATQIYAEADRDKALKLMQRVG